MNNYNNVKKIINCIYEQRTDKNNFKKISTLKTKVNKMSKYEETEVFKKKILKVSTYINRVIKFLEKMK